MKILTVILSLILGMSKLPSTEISAYEFKDTYRGNYYSRSYELPLFLMEKMYGKSVEKGNKVIGSLVAVDVAYRDFNNDVKVGTLIVNKSVDYEIQEIFREIYFSAFNIYQINPVSYFDGKDDISMKNNNSSAFNYRYIQGSKRLSNHSFGLALDINPVQNPFVKKGRVYPEEGEKYLDRSLSDKGLITEGSSVVKIFKKYGWTWGGDWKTSKDYQHFEKIK